jgi:pimeloyl-ACP methyl ester carboxylesterase
MDDPRLIHVGERVLRVRSLGAGTPILYAHGAFGSILEQPFAGALLTQLGVQLVLIERPGFGDSTRHEGRTLATWVDDMRAVLDEMNLPSVRILGWAAGVPYALASAARAPDRVTALSLVAPWFEGEARQVDPSAPAAVAVCRDELARGFAPVVQLLRRGANALLDGILAQMPEPDRALSPETRAMLAASYVEGLRNGEEPVVDEGLVLRMRWPFAIEEITCDVEVWSGDADVRAASSLRLLAERLPHARQRVLAEGGHYIVFTHGHPILSSLASLRART